MSKIKILRISALAFLLILLASSAASKQMYIEANYDEQLFSSDQWNIREVSYTQAYEDKENSCAVVLAEADPGSVMDGADIGKIYYRENTIIQSGNTFGETGGIPGEDYTANTDFSNTNEDYTDVELAEWAVDPGNSATADANAYQLPQGDKLCVNPEDNSKTDGQNIATWIDCTSEREMQVTLASSTGNGWKCSLGSTSWEEISIEEQESETEENPQISWISPENLEEAPFNKNPLLAKAEVENIPDPSNSLIDMKIEIEDKNKTLTTYEPSENTANNYQLPEEIYSTQCSDNSCTISTTYTPDAEGTVSFTALYGINGLSNSFTVEIQDGGTSPENLGEDSDSGEEPESDGSTPNSEDEEIDSTEQSGDDGPTVSEIKNELKVSKNGKMEITGDIEVEKEGEIVVKLNQDTLDTSEDEQLDVDVQQFWWNWESDQVGYEDFNVAPSEDLPDVTVSDWSNWMLLVEHGHADLGIPVKNKNGNELTFDTSDATGDWDNAGGSINQECNVLSEYGPLNGCSLPLGHYEIQGLVKKKSGSETDYYRIKVYELPFEVVNTEKDVSSYSDSVQDVCSNTNDYHELTKCKNQEVLPTCTKDSPPSKCGEGLKAEVCPSYTPSKPYSLEDLETAKCGGEDSGGEGGTGNTEAWASYCKQNIDFSSLDYGKDDFDPENSQHRTECLTGSAGLTESCISGNAEDSTCQSICDFHAQKLSSTEEDFSVDLEYSEGGDVICEVESRTGTIDMAANERQPTDTNQENEQPDPEQEGTTDSDGDGIPDENDACPNEVGVEQNQGCPPTGVKVE